MSYDLAVWHSDMALSDDDASEFYGHLCGEWVIVREHPALLEFCRELMAEFPGVLDPAVLQQDLRMPGRSMLLTYKDLVAGAKSPRIAPPRTEPEPPPWRVVADFNGLAIIMSLGSRKSEISPAIKRLANAVGLIAYNPQLGRCSLPPHLASLPTQPLPQPARLVIEEADSSLEAEISCDGTVWFKGPVPSRLQAHGKAREETLALGRLAYEVEDRHRFSNALPARLPPSTPGQDHVFDLLQKIQRSPVVPPEGWDEW